MERTASLPTGEGLHMGFDGADVFGSARRCGSC
jgi:hypothetical protein